MNTMCLLSGDQDRDHPIPLAKSVIFFAFPETLSRRYISFSPDSSLQYASHLPLGDHEGDLSHAPLVLVRLMITPFSAGMLNSSPLASNTERFASGDSSKLLMLLPTFTVRGIRVDTSVTTLTFTSAYLLVERLSK